MGVPSTEVLLAAWERGLARRPAERALLLLGTTEADDHLEHLADLPIGERNRRLLHLRERLFGTELCSLAACPACGNPVELRLPVPVAQPAAPESAAPPGVECGGYTLKFRLPTSRDLLEMPADDAGQARRWLAERCARAVSSRGRTVRTGSWPEEVLTALGRQMADADPLAVIELALDCPACRHRWEALLEIAAFLWEEIDQWARRVLRDVHRLARAYAWSEADILRLSAWRRQAYLEMLD